MGFETKKKRVVIMMEISDEELIKNEKELCNHSKRKKERIREWVCRKMRKTKHQDNTIGEKGER